jgi:MFS family permease
VRLDLTPLRTSRDFRVLFVAGFVFFLGAMVGYVAVPFQLYSLTGSNFAVGAYGLVQLVPLVLAGLYGGALADRLDRRRCSCSPASRRSRERRCCWRTRWRRTRRCPWSTASGW